MSTFKMSVVYTGKAITVASPSGMKSCTIPTNHPRIDELTSDEQTLIYSLSDRPQGITRIEEFTLDELHLLRGIREKLAVNMETVVKETIKTTASQIERRTFGHGIDYDEQRITQLQRMLEKAKDGYVMLIYDIPTKKNAQCPNPSWLLWQHGFRLNKSCWVLPKNNSGVDHPRVKKLMSHWTVHQIEQHVIPYAEYANDQIRDIARLKLQQELIERHRSLIKTIDKADRLLGEALEKGEDHTKSQDKRDKTVRRRIKTAKKALDVALKCAELYDITEQVSDLLTGLRSAIKAQAEAFNVHAQLHRIDPIVV